MRTPHTRSIAVPAGLEELSKIGLASALLHYSVSTADPPWQTLTKQDILGQKVVTCALHSSWALIRVESGQLSIPGLMGVFPPGNNRSSAATPSGPMRAFTASLASSTGFPLKFPHWPSWPSCLGMVIFTLM